MQGHRHEVLGNDARASGNCWHRGTQHGKWIDWPHLQYTLHAHVRKLCFEQHDHRDEDVPTNQPISVQAWNGTHGFILSLWELQFHC